MKKLIIIIAIIGLLPMHRPVLAQSPISTSMLDYYSSEIGRYVIIRNDINCGGELIYYEDVNDRSFFLYRQFGFHAGTYKYTWPNNTIPNLYKFHVTDMVILKEACYFCGSFTDVAQNKKVGLVGHIYMNDIANYPVTTASIHFNFCTIPKTREFSQMDAINNMSGGAKICLVGESISSTPSCAAFVEWTPYSWDYRVVEVLDPDETMTDIAFSGKGDKVVAVSRYEIEPYKFGLRGDYVSNLFVFNPLTPPTAFPNFTHRNTFNTYGLYLASSSNPHPTWHDNDIVARIVSPPDSETFTVAYECVDNTLLCETKQQVALFRIDVSTFPWNYNMNLTGKQMVHGYFNEFSTFSDITYNPYKQTFAILHSSPFSSKGKSSVVQFPSWLNYGQIPTLLTDNEVYTSIDVPSSYMLLAGYGLHGNAICNFQQNINHLESSCYQTRPYSVSEELIRDGWSAYEEPQALNYYYTGNKQGSIHGSNVTEIPLYNTCESKRNQ